MRLCALLSAIAISGAVTARADLGYHLEQVAYDSYGVHVRWSTDREPPYYVGVYRLTEIGLSRRYPIASARTSRNEAYLGGDFTGLGVFVQVGDASSFATERTLDRHELDMYRRFVRTPYKRRIMEVVDRYQRDVMRLVGDYRWAGFVPGDAERGTATVELGRKYSRVNLGSKTIRSVTPVIAGVRAEPELLQYGDNPLSVDRMDITQTDVGRGWRTNVEEIVQAGWYTNVYQESVWVDDGESEPYIDYGPVVTNVYWMNAEAVTNVYWYWGDTHTNIIFRRGYVCTNLVVEMDFKETHTEIPVWDYCVLPAHRVSFALTNDTHTGSGWRVMVDELTGETTAVRAYSSREDRSEELVMPRGYVSLSAHDGWKRTTTFNGHPAFVIETNAVPKRIYGGGL